MTPTELTLKHLRAGGIPCAKVEHWNAHAKCRQDMFGIIDIVALDPMRGVVGIQATTLAHAAERFLKLTGEKAQASLDWLRTPGTKLEVWGWRRLKLKRGGRAVRWEPDIREITPEDINNND